MWFIHSNLDITNKSLYEFTNSRILCDFTEIFLLFWNFVWFHEFLFYSLRYFYHFLAHCTGIELGGSSHMMLSMQYLNPRRPYKKPNFPKSSNYNSRDRRFSGTFIPEHHVITMPPSLSSSKVNKKFEKLLVYSYFLSRKLIEKKSV